MSPALRVVLRAPTATRSVGIVGTTSRQASTAFLEGKKTSGFFFLPPRSKTLHVLIFPQTQQVIILMAIDAIDAIFSDQVNP